MSNQTTRKPLNTSATTEKERLLLLALDALDKLGVSPDEVHAYRFLREEFASMEEDGFQPTRDDVASWDDHEPRSSIGETIVEDVLAIGDEIAPDNWLAEGNDL